MTGELLPGLPGADADPGSGPADLTCFESLLTDRGGPAEHARHRLAGYADLLGPLAVGASDLEPFRAALPAGSHALQVLLVADPADPRDGLSTLREARNGLFDDDRVQVVGVQLALPATTEPAVAAAALLAALDFTVPAWVEVPPVPGWERALEVLAKDGSEHVALRSTAPAAGLAEAVRRAVDLDLSFRVTGDVTTAVRGSAGPDTAAGTDPDGGPNGAAAAQPGLLNLLCAVRAALNGAEPPGLAEVLACTDHAPLASAVRRMSAADAAVCRAFLTGVDTTDVGGLVEDLRALGLL